MARQGIEYSDVKQAVNKLLSQGYAPSVQRIREQLGTGSNTTIAEHLKTWREEQLNQNKAQQLPTSLPAELHPLMEALWQTAVEQVQNQMAAYKEAVEQENKIIRQQETDAKKEIALLNNDAIESIRKAEAEILKSQKLEIELNVVCEKLVQADAMLLEQKKINEAQIKATLNERQMFTSKVKELELELRKAQDSALQQEESNKKLLLKMQNQQDQSEIRWLRIIDQAKQDLLSEQKNSDKERSLYEQKINGLKEKINTDANSNYEIMIHNKSLKDELTRLEISYKNLEKRNSDLNHDFRQIAMSRKFKKVKEEA